MANILVVDDSAIMRKTLKTILTNAGHNIVSEAENGKIAIEQYEKYHPDIVTMDITMPILNGLQATQEILAKDPAAKIIMISALAQKEMVLKAIEIGAANFIIKPITGQKVVATILAELG